MLANCTDAKADLLLFVQRPIGAGDSSTLGLARRLIGAYELTLAPTARWMAANSHPA